MKILLRHGKSNGALQYCPVNVSLDIEFLSTTRDTVVTSHEIIVGDDVLLPTRRIN